MILMSIREEFYTVIRKDRRITVPKQFKPGEPVKVVVERIIKTDEKP